MIYVFRQMHEHLTFVYVKQNNTESSRKSVRGFFKKLVAQLRVLISNSVCILTENGLRLNNFCSNLSISQYSILNPSGLLSLNFVTIANARFCIVSTVLYCIFRFNSIKCIQSDCNITYFWHNFGEFTLPATQLLAVP